MVCWLRRAGEDTLAGNTLIVAGPPMAPWGWESWDITPNSAGARQLICDFGPLLSQHLQH